MDKTGRSEDRPPANLEYSADSFGNLPLPGSQGAQLITQVDDDDLVSQGGRSGGMHSRTHSGVSNASFSKSKILDQMTLMDGEQDGVGSDDDGEQFLESQEPHHTYGAYPYLNWDLLELTRGKYSQQYRDRTVEAEFVRFAFYQCGRSSIVLAVGVGLLGLLQAIVDARFPMVIPIDVVCMLLLALAAGFTFLLQRRKEQLKSYEAVCRNCKRQENLGIFIWLVIALLCFNTGPRMVYLNPEICGNLCSNSMRVVAPLGVLGLVGLRIVPRLHLIVPLIAFSYILFILGLCVATEKVELHHHGEVIHTLAATVFLSFIVLVIIIDRNRRAEFELSTHVYTMQNKWRQQKKQYSAFLSEMMPPSALNRIMGNQDVVDVTMEGSVAHCELYDYSQWADRQQNPHLVLVFVNTFVGAMDIRSAGTGLDKVEARGDAYIAVCGVSSLINNHASRACTYILTLNRLTSDCVRRTGVHPVGVRCSAHTGPLMGMVIGDRMRYDIFGPALALARTLCQTAPPGGCCVSYNTMQSLVANQGGSYLKIAATKTRIPLAGVEQKQAVAYTLRASDAWDPNFLVLPPKTAGDEVNFTESMRSTFLASTVTNEGAYEPPNALDLKSFAAYTRRGQDTSGANMEEEFSALHRVLKHRPSKRCVGQVVFPEAVENAYLSAQSVPTQLMLHIVACSVIAFLSFGATLISILVEGRYTEITLTCAIIPLCVSVLGLLFIKKRLLSPVLDAIFIWGPWVAGTLLLSASAIELHTVLKDPVVFRSLSALHHLAIPRRFSVKQTVTLDVLVNCATNAGISIAYYQSKMDLGPIVFTVLLVLALTLVSNALLLSSIYNQKKQSLHRCIYQKITTATEWECAVYVALTRIAFPPFCSQEVMTWYLTGKLPEQMVHHNLGPQVVWFASVSVRTVSREDPSVSWRRLNRFQNELEGLLYRAKVMVRFSTNGDTLCLSGPIKTNAVQASQGSTLLPLALDTPTLMEADLDRTVNLSVSLAHSLNEYGKKNSICVTMVGHVCQDVSAVALGYQRMSYNLIGPDVDQTRRVVNVIPENQVHATPSVAQRFDRINSQAHRGENPMATAARDSNDLEEYALKLVFGPVERHTVPTDGKGTTTVDTNALTEL